MLARLDADDNGSVARYNSSMTSPNPLLDILCCPLSHEPLVPLSPNRVKKLNQAIEQGDLQYVDHSPVTETIKAALITRDGKVVYVIADGIPVLLPDRGIGTTQLTDPL